MRSLCGCWHLAEAGGSWLGGRPPQQSCLCCEPAAMQDVGPGRSGKEKSFPCSLAVTGLFHALAALTFCFSPA